MERRPGKRLESYHSRYSMCPLPEISRLEFTRKPGLTIPTVGIPKYLKNLNLSFAALKEGLINLLEADEYQRGAQEEGQI